MKLFKWNKRILTFFGVCALPEESAPRQITIQVTVAVVEIFFLTFFIVFGFLYFWNHYPPFSNCTLAVAQAVGILQTALSFVSLFFRAKQVRNFFDQVQQLYDESASMEIANAYLRMNDFCEKFIKWVVWFTTGAYFVETFVAITVNIVFYYVRDGHVETKNLFLLWQLQLPFDVSTVSGYIYTVIFHELMPVTYYIITVPIESLLLIMGLFMGEFHSNYKFLLTEFNELADVGSPNSIVDERVELKTRLIKAIELHIWAKKIFELCRGTLEETIFVQVVLAALVIAGMLSGFESAARSMDAQGLSGMIGGLSNVMNIFVYCFVGTYITDTFLRYASTTYEIHWYKLPVELQPYVLLIIADANRPRRLSGLGIFDLNLALFTRIIKTAGSYTLMFRK